MADFDPSVNYYRVLGVTRKATIDEIRKAGRRLAFKLHPDRTKGSDEPLKRVNEALRVLSDRDTRARYDVARREFVEAQRQAREQEEMWRRAREEAARKAAAPPEPWPSIFPIEQPPDPFSTAEARWNNVWVAGMKSSTDSNVQAGFFVAGLLDLLINRR